MFKKLLFLVFFVLAAFTMVAAVVPDGYVVPAVVIVLLTGVFIPAFVEGIKLLVAKVPSLEILRSKAAASIYAYLIAVGITAYFCAQAGLLPALPVDPNGATETIIAWASTIFSASTILYNVVIGPIMERLATPTNALAYKLEAK